MEKLEFAKLLVQIYKEAGDGYSLLKKQILNTLRQIGVPSSLVKDTADKSAEMRYNKDAGDDDGVWRTTDDGHKIFINGEGEVTKGNPNVLNAIKNSGGKVKNGKTSTSSVKTGKNGNLSAKSEGAQRIDTKDAASEKRDNSLKQYIDEDGNLSPERQAVHDEIIRNIFADKVPMQGKATLVMSGGGPASGKTFVANAAEAEYGGDTTVTINPDDFKAMLPGYEKMALEDDDAASYYHEESSALAKRAYQFAVDNNINVVYDGTGDGSPNSVLKKLKTAQDAGYAVKASYVTVDTDEALRRNQGRYESGLKKYLSGESKIPPRKPPEQMVIATHSAVSDVSIQVADKFDTFELWDNNGKKNEQIKIAECTKGGELRAVPGQEERLQRYLDKGKLGAKVVDGKVVY